MGDDPNQQGNSRRWITQAVESSLRRLQTDHIDLYQIHRPSPDTDIEETLAVLTDLIRAAKVRTIGSSTFPPPRSWRRNTTGRDSGEFAAPTDPRSSRSLTAHQQHDPPTT
jgi:aryl-alcohol dehydrogenase-like predicted oxidoreductase